MADTIVGSWIRTASARGVLICSFDPGGSYELTIASSGQKERGTYRLVLGAPTSALILTTDAGQQTAIVLSLRGDELLLDGQRWRRQAEI